MRTRIRPPSRHQTGRRRRSPDEHVVLQLQRTIGNRATTRLLRQPVEAPPKPASKQPEVLKKAGVTTDARVNDKTAGLIQAALEESVELAPYLKGKFPKYAITKGFELHTDEDDFNTAVKTIVKKNTEPMTKNQRAAAYGKIGGFYDRASNTVHVRRRSTFGHTVHESMHKVASSGFHTFWGDFINEGVTQYFADRLLVEHGLSKVTDHEYKDELACAEKLVALTDWKTVAGAYFQNDGALREAVMRKLNLDLLGLTKAVRAGTVCSRLQ
jgi:hypothetical protein